MDFDAQKREINRELNRVEQLLKQTMPRYSELLGKTDLSGTELNELGELEYYLIELNGKIAQLQAKLEYDLFGLSLDTFYKLKKQAQQGDQSAALKVAAMRRVYARSLKNNQLIIWN